jgi:hypothetical protein
MVTSIIYGCIYDSYQSFYKKKSHESFHAVVHDLLRGLFVNYVML